MATTTNYQIKKIDDKDTIVCGECGSDKIKQVTKTYWICKECGCCVYLES